MNQATFCFFGELNDFLPEKMRRVSFVYGFKGNPSVKHIIEALGVPHTEVHQIMVADRAVDFHYLVLDQDQIYVYPVSQTNTRRPGIFENDRLNPEPRFVIDNHLGRLAAYLRMSGFDVLYRNDYQDEELAWIASQEERILLTRDRRLLMRNMVKFGYCVRHLKPKLQLVEVLRRYDLFESIRPFRRCLRCNHPLQPVSKEAILDRLEPLTRQYFDEFHTCPNCEQIYWKGSHYERMLKLLTQIIQTNQSG